MRMSSSISHPRFTNGQCVSEMYYFGTNIGQGNYGVVRTCMDMNDSGAQMACKTMSYSSMTNMMVLNDIQREVNVMLELGAHPNLVELKGVHRDREGWHLVMELCKGGELFDEVMRRGRFSEPDAADTIQQLAAALDCCHSRNVIHRDVKLENVLLVKPIKRKLSRRARKEAEQKMDELGQGSGGGGAVRGKIHVKLADFGLALCLKQGQKLTGVAGSPLYMAPEVVKGDPYSFQADIWSLGVILYSLLCGLLPFVGSTNDRIFQAVKRANIDFSCPAWQEVSDEAKSLVRRLLSVEPSERPSAREISMDPWILKHASSVYVQSSAAMDALVTKCPLIEWDTENMPTSQPNE